MSVLGWTSVSENWRKPYARSSIRALSLFWRDHVRVICLVVSHPAESHPESGTGTRWAIGMRGAGGEAVASSLAQRGSTTHPKSVLRAAKEFGKFPSVTWKSMP